MVQIDYAIDEEMATTLIDVFLRRTQLFLRDHDQALGAAAAVADRMAARLGWDAARKAAEISAYELEVARSRRWRSEPATSS
jgi:glycerol-3-phosphate dehydrogenase